MTISQAALSLNKTETAIQFWMTKFSMSKPDMEKLAKINKMSKDGYSLPRIKHKLNNKTYKRA